ncbi:MAG TPA: TetR/AcrR family transcriptional regulator [Mycobacteriales bacterium]|nr:TetR/AcrR family transcriptional regulator [Mycobacteriales bacterium]
MSEEPSASRRRLPRSARRRQLLTAAQEVFVAQGYHAAAMDDIAEVAGVSKPVLYQHFPGKLELYLALLDEHCDALARAVRKALASTTDNRLRVAESIRAYYDFVSDESGAFRLVFESDLRNEPAVRDRVEGSLRSSVQAIADTIAADTGLSGGEAELLSCGLEGLAEISARWWMSVGAEQHLDKERAIALMTGLAWRGISGFPRAEPQPETGH